MGRLIKCQAKNCRNGGKVDTDEAFVYYHYTKKGNLQKKKYCDRNEFHEEYLENMWYNRSRRRVDRILGVKDVELMLPWVTFVLAIKRILCS